ncbi:MAG: DUF58 domain-containing protein [Bacteroidales bacterium]|nr:DUF58 domain-containing protein [Bacteroidales bacterium]
MNSKQAVKERTELLKKVRKFEIKSRGLTQQVFAGEYHSAFKGKGMTFSEVREYQYGDDIRAIDWNVTARFNHPYIKVHEEERELTVMLLIDISGSGDFGTKSQLKKDLITEVAAVLSFSAIDNNDKIGVILFSDKVEKFIPPQKGKKHILRIIKELLEFTPENYGTNISESLRYLTNAIKKRCTAFLISDFRDTGYARSLQIANNKHDLVAMHIYDRREMQLPNVGLIRMKDNESGKERWVDTGMKNVRDNYAMKWNSHQEMMIDIFKKSGVDYVDLETGSDYVKPLIKLFKRRG